MSWLRRLLARFRRDRAPKITVPEYPHGSRADLYQRAEITRDWAIESIGWYLGRMMAGQQRYEAVSRETGIPWQIVAALHMLECSGRFDQHLHNGDPLDARTVRVPKGLPKVFPCSWEESAIDAMRHDHLTGLEWDDLQEVLTRLEYYNGRGYEYRAKPSPYLWGGSQFFHKGKYVADGKYDPRAETRQIGVALLLKRIGWKVSKE